MTIAAPARNQRPRRDSTARMRTASQSAAMDAQTAMTLEMAKDGETTSTDRMTSGM